MVDQRKTDEAPGGILFVLNLPEGFLRTRLRQIGHRESHVCSGIIRADLECLLGGRGGLILPSGVV